MSDSLRQLLQDVKAKGQTGDFYERCVDLAVNSPNDVASLAMALAEETPPRIGNLLKRILAFMPLEDFPRVVGHVLDVKSRQPQNKAVDDVVLSTSLQCVSVLHPHLTTIFELRPNAHAYFESSPWRESGTQHLDYLKGVIDNRTASRKTRERAWQALLETREKTAFDAAIARFPSIDFEYAVPVKSYLHQVGFEVSNNEYRQLYPNVVYHMLFPKEYFEEKDPLLWKHPSWHIPATQSVTAVFGGAGSGQCAVCGDVLDHILTFDPIPDGLPVTGMDCLKLATCLSCLGWEQERLFYQHNASGQATSIAYNGPIISPQFPSPSFKQVEIRIAETPSRWRWQNWGQENLHRIGGHPIWIQDAEYPECPNCHTTMEFLLQLDSDINHGWLWGSGGICYVSWCDQCKVSGFLWQCT